MTTETKLKTLHYRRAEFLKGKHDLQQLVNAALVKLHFVQDRLETITTGGKELRLINNHSAQLGMHFGNLLFFEPGTHRLSLTSNMKVQELNVKTVAPPPIEGQPSEFLEAILLFGIRSNHVIALQSAALKTSQLEAHLNWLLKASGMLSNNNHVALVDSPHPSVREAIEKMPPKKIHFGSSFLGLESVPTKSPTTDPVDIDKSVEVKSKFAKIAGVGPAVLRSLLGAEKVASLGLDEAIDGNLKIAVEITYERKTSDGGANALRAISHALRDVDLGEVQVSIPGVGRVDAKHLKLSDQRRFKSYSGLLDQAEVYKAMHDWLTQLLQQGMVADPKV